MFRGLKVKTVYPVRTVWEARKVKKDFRGREVFPGTLWMEYPAKWDRPDYKEKKDWTVDPDHPVVQVNLVWKVTKVAPASIVDQEWKERREIRDITDGTAITDPSWQRILWRFWSGKRRRNHSVEVQSSGSARSYSELEKARREKHCFEARRRKRKGWVYKIDLCGILWSKPLFKYIKTIRVKTYTLVGYKTESK